MFRLGKFYQDGTAGEPDTQKAYLYYLLASLALPEAKTAADSLAPQLSKRDRERAHKKSLDMFSKISGRPHGQCVWTD